MKNRLYTVLSRIILISTAIALFFSFRFAFACAPSVSTPFDAEKAFERLLSEVHFADEMNDASEFAEYAFAGLPDGTEVKMYSCGGKHADAVIMCRASNASELTVIRSAIEEYIASSRQNAERYEPQEVSKYDSAIWYENGSYIFVCITEDVSAVRAILK